MILEGQSEIPSFIAKIEFNFSYKRRANLSKVTLESKEELRQLERLRKKKNIQAIIDTIRAVNG